MEPPAKKQKKQLLDDDSSDENELDGGTSLSNGDAGFKVNEEYARRFEHNKKREELQRRSYKAISPTLAYHFCFSKKKKKILLIVSCLYSGRKIRKVRWRGEEAEWG